jgi:hypothetical protein
MSKESRADTDSEVNPPGVSIRFGIPGFVNESLFNFTQHQNVQIRKTTSFNPIPIVFHDERITVCLKKVKPVFL